MHPDFSDNRRRRNTGEEALAEGEPPSPQRASGRLVVDVETGTGRPAGVAEGRGPQMCSCVRAVTIGVCCSDIIILVVPPFTFNGSSLEDISPA